MLPPTTHHSNVVLAYKGNHLTCAVKYVSLYFHLRQIACKVQGTLTRSRADVKVEWPSAPVVKDRLTALVQTSTALVQGLAFFFVACCMHGGGLPGP